MKKALSVLSACGLLTAGIFASVTASGSSVSANSDSVLPTRIHYLNTLDYLGTTGRLGGYSVLSAGCGLATGSGWTNNLMENIDEELTTDFVVSVDHGWGFQNEYWSKVAWEICFGQEVVNIQFQRNTDPGVSPLYTWINNWEAQSNLWDRGGYLNALPDNILGSWHNFKAAFHQNRVTVYLDNTAIIDTDFATLGIHGGTVTSIRFGGDNINDAGSYIDNVMVESYDLGGGAETAYDVTLGEGWTPNGDGTYTASNATNNYVRHLARNHSIRLEADVKLTTSSFFDLMSYDIVDSSVAANCDHSLATRFQWVGDRYVAYLVYATDAGWVTVDIPAAAELVPDTWVNLATSYTSDRIIVTFDSKVVLSKTWAELGLHKSVAAGSIHYVNYAGSTTTIANPKQVELYEGAASILNDVAVKNEVNGFATTYMANRETIGGVYSICGAIVDEAKGQAIVNAYDALSQEAKATLERTFDGAATIGETVAYIRSKLQAQATAKIAESFTEPSNAFVGLIAVSGAVLTGALLLRKRKHN